MSAPTNLKTSARLSFVFFLVMLMGSVYYWEERMFFADASHIAFSAINEETLQIQQYRFGAFITQMLLVLGAKLGLPIRAIMMAYSASFHLFYLFVSAIMLFGFKAYRLGVLYALYWCLVTTHTFFWPNNEVHQGIAYMFLLFPILIASGERQWNFIIPLLSLLVLGTTAAFCHPLVLPPFIFLWVYLIAEKKYWKYNRQQTILLSAVLLAITIAKLYVSKVYSGYDMGLLGGVSNMKPSDIADAFTSPFARAVYEHIPVNYTLLPIIAIVGAAALLYTKQYLLAAWSLGCTIVYFILLCLTFSSYIEFASESALMPVIIIACAPFVFVVLPLVKKEFAFIIVLLIFGVRTYRFIETSPQFPQRVQELSHIIAKMKKAGITKLVLVKDPAMLTEWRWMVDWGMGAESMILEACIWDKPIRQIVVVKADELANRLPANNTDVIGCFKTFPIEGINMKYFPVDTTRPYTVMNYEDFMN